MLEEGYRYEERKRKWMSELDPRTDREEYFAHQQVLTSMMLDGVHAAYIEQTTTEIEEADGARTTTFMSLGNDCITIAPGWRSRMVSKPRAG